MLQSLRERGFGTALLSNGEPKMLDAAVNGAGIADLLDAVLSIEAIRIYKPDARVYHLATKHFGCKTKAICFMSSNAWDVAGAAHFGFQVCWIDRFNQPRERLSGEPRAVLSDLSPLSGMLEQESGLSTFS